VLIDSTALVVLAQSSSGPGLAGQSTRHLYFWILVPDEYEMNSLVLVPLPNAGGKGKHLGPKLQIACLVNTACVDDFEVMDKHWIFIGLSED
jgi:hypothetical protein